MSTELEREAKEILEWELSLDARDIRSHAWYHGALSRQKAEQALENNGDFLVRDCSSSGRAGDFVLSCRWDDNNLHFLVHKDVVQKDTIYEQLRYRFENDTFDTIPDLITYHVGGGIPISASSGALITNPKNRTSPLLNVAQRSLVLNDGRGGSDYVSLMRAGSPVAVAAAVEKISTLERMKQKCLNLNPPDGLLDDLEKVPTSMAIKMSQLHVTNSSKKDDSENRACEKSNFDLTSFSSILLPATNVDKSVKLDPGLIETVITRILEASDRAVALYLTKIDWEVLTKKPKKDKNSSTSANNNGDANKETMTAEVDNGSVHHDNDNDDDEEEVAGDVYELFFHNSQHRWNNVIERSLTLSHFVMLTILRCQEPEKMFSKWVAVAGELKSALIVDDLCHYGNFFSFSSVMRALLMPQITRSDGKVNWMRLRQDFTTAAFTFETSLRASYQGLIRGTESYPPNTTIPELLSAALIFEDAIEIMPISCISGEDQLPFFFNHLKELRSQLFLADIQISNKKKLVVDSQLDDIVLMDLFRTEFHLLLLWGAEEYASKSLQCRINDLIND